MLTPGDRARRSQAGSVLMLVPAGVLVLFALGSIALDSAVAFMAQRELTSAAAAAANDAAGAALSDARFYRGTGGDPGDVVLDADSAARLADAALAPRVPSGISDVRRTVQVRADQVCVTVTGRVAYIFAKAIPGMQRGRTVTGRAVATAVRGDDRAGVAADAGDVC